MTPQKAITPLSVSSNVSTTTTTENGNTVKWIDWSAFSLKSGWNSVEDFGKRIGGLAALFVFGAMLMPIWTPGQDGLMRYQISQNAERISAAEKRLDTIPEAIAVIKERQEQQIAQLRDTREEVSSIKTTQYGQVLGALLFLMAWLFKVFGGKLMGMKED